MMTFVLPKLLDLYKILNPSSLHKWSLGFQTLCKTTELLCLFFFLKHWCSDFCSIITKSTCTRLLYAQGSCFWRYYSKSVLVESTRTLSILIISGVPILEAINIVKSTTSNMLYREAYESVYSDIEKGRNLGDALSETDLFPTIFVQMASVGERTGKLDDTLMRLSIYFQMESEIAIKTAMTLIEPLILVVL